MTIELILPILKAIGCGIGVAIGVLLVGNKVLETTNEKITFVLISFIIAVIVYLGVSYLFGWR